MNKGKKERRERTRTQGMKENQEKKGENRGNEEKKEGYRGGTKGREAIRKEGKTIKGDD